MKQFPSVDHSSVWKCMATLKNTSQTFPREFRCFWFRVLLWQMYSTSRSVTADRMGNEYYDRITQHTPCVRVCLCVFVFTEGVPVIYTLLCFYTQAFITACVFSFSDFLCNLCDALFLSCLKPPSLCFLSVFLLVGKII